MSHGQNLLARYLRNIFDEVPLVDYRPQWLGGLEIDFFFQIAGVAFEFNGDQHVVPTVDLGSHIPQKSRDWEKMAMLRRMGIRVIIVEAIDLNYNRLRNRVGKMIGFEKLKPRNKKLKGLDRDSVKYRQLLREKYDSPTSHKRGSNARRKVFEKAMNIIESGIQPKTSGMIHIQFDGGSSCNIPAKGYGKGYGSYKIGDQDIKRVEFGMGHSSNSAELLTLASAIEDLASQVALSELHIHIIGDSQIALKWAKPRAKTKPSAKSSANFLLAIQKLQSLVDQCKKVTTQWRGRSHSVALFGH